MASKSQLLLIFLLICFFTSLNAETRKAFDNIGYCWDKSQLELLINYLRSNHQEISFNSEETVCAVCPHDDHLYSSDATYPLMKNLKAKEVIIFGVTHKKAREILQKSGSRLVFDTYSAWQGVYCDIKVSELRNFLIQKLPSDIFTVNNAAHDREHSIEALLPMLQHFNRDVKITPVMVQAGSFESTLKTARLLADAVSEYVKKKKLITGRDIKILISSDANHYGSDFKNTIYGNNFKAHKRVLQEEKRLVRDFLTGQISVKKIKDLLTDNYFNKSYWCGKFSISLGLLTTREIMKKKKYDIHGKLILYSDTLTKGVLPVRGRGLGVTAPFSPVHWVGHLSAVYLKKK